MTKHYFFIISTGDKQTLTLGWCGDIEKTVKFWKCLPNLAVNEAGFNKLVYVEEHQSQESAKVRFGQINAAPLASKRELIESVNPDWIDLVIGKNFDFKSA